MKHSQNLIILHYVDVTLKTWRPKIVSPFNLKRYLCKSGFSCILRINPKSRNHLYPLANLRIQILIKSLMSLEQSIHWILSLKFWLISLVTILFLLLSNLHFAFYVQNQNRITAVKKRACTQLLDWQEIAASWSSDYRLKK